MNLKKKLKAFFTFKRRRDGGFTLVELIVVIAILAILAAVGSAGYAGYIKASSKGNDKVLVGNVMRALETAVYSNVADFTGAGQYSDGLRVPVGFVVLSNEVLTDTETGKTGSTIALSTNTEADPMHKALVNALGADYTTAYKLSSEEWRAGTIGGSNLYKATGDMLSTLAKTGKLMVGLQDAIQLTAEKYDDTGDMIVTVAENITAKSKDEFVDAWMGATDATYNSNGFEYLGRENYSAIRIAYNNSFAEYVRKHYSDKANADSVADQIANYGQSAGQLAYDEVIKRGGNGFLNKLAAAGAKELADGLAPGAVFSYTANRDAINNDTNYIGHTSKGTEIKELYEKWLAESAESDAATFYDTMLTAAKDGKNYYNENGSDEFVNWIQDSAESYAANLGRVQGLIDANSDASTIVVAVYYQDGKAAFDVFSAEADPRIED